MRTVETSVFTFDELSDRAKETAREWWRESESQEFGAFGEIFEPAETAAALLGIAFDYNRIPLHGGKTRTEPDIRYSGFCSQGDGASFVGTYSSKTQPLPAVLRAEFPQDQTLHDLADALHALRVQYRLLTGHWFDVKVTQDGHYVHKFTMSVEVTDETTGQEIEDVQISNNLLELMRDFAQWIYDGLEAEYDYRMSDENVDESIRTNEYEFDEDGESA